jgi:hypothetical protein
MRNRLLATAVACFAITSGFFVLAKPPAQLNSARPAASTVQPNGAMTDDSMTGMMGDASKIAHTPMPAYDNKPLNKNQTDFFETKVRPILVANCYSCHSEENHKSKGALVLDTRAGWQKGGEDGAIIIPGNPDKSMLIKAVRYKDEDLQMPPDNKKLRDGDIGILEQWVKMGAPDPRVPGAGGKLTGLTDKARAHWSYQPLKQMLPPKVKNEQWVKSPIDNFVLAKLEQNDIQPSKPATRETLIRRATYDLIGLPPTPEEVEAFVKDESSDSFAKVVDRLLASPHFGERWGRYWLDTARYSDTSGSEKNQAAYRYPYAWTYRDYVIQSFNADKPYDQFIKEQLAADQLPQSQKDPSRLAALGFLTVGKRFQNPNDTIDERIDATCKGFLGMTVSCARCHDHKFDPIPQADYYSLHGVFASTVEPARKPLISQPPASDPVYLDFEQKLNDLEGKDRDRYYSIIQGKATEFRKNAAWYIMVATLNRRSEASEILLRDKIIADHHLDRDLVQTAGRYFRGNLDVFWPMIELWQAGKDNFNEAAPRVLQEIAAGGNQRRKINAIVIRAFAGMNASQFHSLQDFADIYGKLFAFIDKNANDYLKAAQNPKTAALPGYDPAMVQLFNIPAEIELASNLTTDRLTEIAPTLPLVNQQGYNRLNLSEINELLLTHPGSPPRAMVVADSPTPKNSPVFIRGEANNKGPIAPRQFLAVLSKNRHPFTHGSGRLELAEDIASKDNPLTARVMVNRIWMHLFGAGFVRTPDDLGVQCEDPSHPELLDFLARQFMARNWSIKQTIRSIMLSNTYQQSSETNPTYAAKDSENRLLWRANLRRLDFEAIRDSMLMFTGKLDPTLGGNPVNLTDEPYSNRRSVYGYIDRGTLPELLSEFDFADPDMANSKRTSTIVPQQALFFMNSPMCVDVARKVTTRQEFVEASTAEGKIASLYAILFQRAPRPEEIEFAKEFLDSAGGDDNSSERSPADLRAQKQEQAKFARRQQAIEQQIRKGGRAGNRAPIRNTEGTVVERRPLSAWEQYAQALLFTNEIAYVN